MSVRQFFNSPQNRTGISIWAGTMITASIQYFVFHQAISSIDLFGLILGFLKIVEPENTVTIPQLQKSITDIRALFARPTSESLVNAASDVNGFVKAIVD
ncbi:MAG: hypothetical protein KGQ26_00400 [Rhodospirillales bacterium]|nr:hypothetical protein [Rhodospirillales bacterium]